MSFPTLVPDLIGDPGDIRESSVVLAFSVILPKTALDSGRKQEKGREPDDKARD